MRPLIVPTCLFVIAAGANASPPANIGLTRIEGPARSAKALRDAGVVKQGYDYSCGAAAIATLLTYGFDDPTSEADVLADILQRLSADQESQVHKRGLSLLDLQQFAQRRGYRAQGFRIPADQINRLSRPVMVFIRPFGYEHFAVLKGVHGDRVLLADPSQGNWRMPLYRFLDMWRDESGQGIVFALERADGRWVGTSPLYLDNESSARPELLTVQQMLDLRPATLNSIPLPKP